MTQITFPDNAVKEFDTPPTGMDVAKSISEGFARNCVAMKIDGQLLDLSCVIKADARISFTTANDEEGLEILRHSSAHIMAEAVLNLYPDAKLTIGPVVEELSETFGDKVKFAKCNVDNNPVTPGKYGIKAIPTLIFFKDGNVVEQR